MVIYWPEIKNPKKYEGQRVVIGSVTDGYNPQEKEFGNTRKLLEQLRGSGADIMITTKSDLVVRNLDLLKELGQVTVSWSINVRISQHLMIVKVCIPDVILSVVQLEQIRTIDKQRVIRYFGKLDRSMMRKVESGILVSLGIYRHNRKLPV